MTDVEDKFENWWLAVGHWKFIMGPRYGDQLV